MSSPEEKPSSRSEMSVPRAVRWDRKLRSEIADCSSQPSVSMKFGDVLVAQSTKRRLKHYFRRKAVALLKAPVSRLRDFFLAPIHFRFDASNTRLDASYSAALVQQQLSRSIAQSIDTLQAEIQNARAELQSVQRDLGYLHQKFDEGALKTRPVLHFEGAYAVPLADGYLFIPEEEEALLLMYAGAGSSGLEPGTRRILQAVVGPGGRAIDVGASVGLHTLALARVVGHAGRVDSFEAEPRLDPILRRTLAVNGFSQVHLHNLAIGAADGSASFDVARTIGHSSLYQLGGDEVRDRLTVQVRQLDSVLDTTVPVDVIKIDVEGAELDVISGAKRILDNSPDCAVVAECGPSHLRRTGISVEEWFAAFANHGFEPYGITEPDGLLHRLDLKWVAAQHSINVLFVRRDARVKKKLFSELNLLVES
jgi:FkbM family methyltransferase